MTAVYAIPAARPGYTGYFISTPPSSYHSPSWMSYPPEPEDVPPQWAESVRTQLSHAPLSRVQFCFANWVASQAPSVTVHAPWIQVNLVDCNQWKQNWSVTCASVHCSEFRGHSVRSCDLPLGARLVFLDCPSYPCLCVPAFTRCLFAEPVSFRNHLLNWIYRWRWVETTNSRGRWAHFFKWTLLFLSFFPRSRAGLCAIQNQTANILKIPGFELR